MDEGLLGHSLTDFVSLTLGWMMVAVFVRQESVHVTHYRLIPL